MVIVIVLLALVSGGAWWVMHPRDAAQKGRVASRPLLLAARKSPAPAPAPTVADATVTEIPVVTAPAPQAASEPVAVTPAPVPSPSALPTATPAEVVAGASTEVAAATPPKAPSKSALPASDAPPAPSVINDEDAEPQGEPVKLAMNTRDRVRALANMRKPACVEGMVMVAAGDFQLGSAAEDKLRDFGDLPATRVHADTFCIDMYEFPNEKGASPKTKVTWKQAKEACEDLGKRLCTELEWERACRGPQNSPFPYGEQYEKSACNAGGADEGALASAGAYNGCKSGFGVVDMGGNAAEWTANRWSADVGDRVVRGGSASQAYYTTRCAARANEPGSSRLADLGFRCCAGL